MGDTGVPASTNKHADDDGHFRRKDSAFRDRVSKDPNSKFPAEKGRYVLYCNLGCPWAHRTIIVRALKGLEDIIQIVYTDFDLGPNGWLFTGRNGSADRDPLYGFAGLKQLYLKAEPGYDGRYLVPTLWDKKKETIVSNESAEIIRMFFIEFDDLIDPMYRESNKNGKGFRPEHLEEELDEMNDWVYNTINNGVYKCGFAMSQEAYDANVFPLFKSLDRVEAHLSNPLACHGGPFLFGSHLTEADIRLYTTMARFDAAYHTIFLCNLKSVKSDYPRLYRWLRRLYWNTSGLPKGNVFKDTTFPEIYRIGYTNARERQRLGEDGFKSRVMPRGPLDAYGTWTEEDDEIDNGRLVALKAYIEKNGLDTSGMATPTSSSAGAADIGSLSLNTATKANGKTDLSSGVRSPRIATRGEGNEADGDIDPSRKLTKKATSHYEDQNAKWYKAAKKAEKKSGAPNVHLAL